MATTGWFEEAVEPRAVMAELTKVVPELVDGAAVLLGCKVSRIRSLPVEGSWSAVYELTVRDVATGVERTLMFNGVLTPPDRERPLPSLPGTVAFGAGGCSCAVPGLGLQLDAVPFDDALPGLRVLTDPEEGRRLLERVLREGGHLDPGRRITASVPTVAAHKSGVRAAVLCRLDYAPERGAAPAAVMAKVHHDDQGERAHAAMEAVAAAANGDGPLRLPQPLAYVPELRLCVQEYVDHRGSLKELFHSALSTGDADSWTSLLDAVRASAAGLAQLHQCGTSLGDPVTWDDELATLHKKHDRLMAATSTLRDGTSSMPDRLAAAAGATVADPPGPAHHSFHPAQVC
jgi:hypothetical protein